MQHLVQMQASAFDSEVCAGGYRPERKAWRDQRSAERAQVCAAVEAIVAGPADWSGIRRHLIWETLYEPER